MTIVWMMVMIFMGFFQKPSLAYVLISFEALFHTHWIWASFVSIFGVYSIYSFFLGFLLFCIFKRVPCETQRSFFYHFNLVDILKILALNGQYWMINWVIMGVMLMDFSNPWVAYLFSLVLLFLFFFILVFLLWFLGRFLLFVKFLVKKFYIKFLDSSCTPIFSKNFAKDVEHLLLFWDEFLVFGFLGLTFTLIYLFYILFLFINGVFTPLVLDYFIQLKPFYPPPAAPSYLWKAAKAAPSHLLAISISDENTDAAEEFLQKLKEIQIKLALEKANLEALKQVVPIEKPPSLLLEEEAALTPPLGSGGLEEPIILGIRQAAADTVDIVWNSVDLAEKIKSRALALEHEFAKDIIHTNAAAQYLEVLLQDLRAAQPMLDLLEDCISQGQEMIHLSKVAEKNLEIWNELCTAHAYYQVGHSIQINYW